MRNQPQTFISVIRTTIKQWSGAQRWSRETVAQQVTEAHSRIGADKVTKIEFSDHADVFSRTKVDAERLYRWMDDETKDCTLMPMNMLPSILDALPMDLRLHLLNELARPCGMEVRASGEADCTNFDAAVHVSQLVRENSESVVALLAASANPSPAHLQTALKEVGDVREAAACTERALLARLDADQPANSLRSVGAN